MWMYINFESQLTQLIPRGITNPKALATDGKFMEAHLLGYYKNRVIVLYGRVDFMC